MPSAAETPNPGKSPKPSPWRAGLERWNRKLHFYAGLFLLFFMWLFAFTGMILNHASWTFAESWTNRKEKTYEQALAAPAIEAKGDLGQAKAIMTQLGIEGDIMWTVIRTDPNVFVFQVRRPGWFYFLNADFARKKITVRQAEVNVWGVMKALHTFTGVSLDDPRNTRDWTLTYVWAYSMDAVAAGLIFMVLSSIYMWYALPQKRVPGAVALALGTLGCGLFCVGLRWLF